MVMEKITEFIKDWGWAICSLIFIVLIIYLGVGYFKDWAADRPIHTMTINDLVALVIIHAWISRSDIKFKK